MDGSIVTEIRVYILGDGTGEETDKVVVDASALDGANNASQVREIQWATTGFTALLEYDQTADDPIAFLPEGEGKLCFKKAPIANDGGAGNTGDIVMTTVGLGSGDSGEIIISLKKTRSRGY